MKQQNEVDEMLTKRHNIICTAVTLITAYFLPEFVWIQLKLALCCDVYVNACGTNNKMKITRFYLHRAIAVINAFSVLFHFRNVAVF